MNAEAAAAAPSSTTVAVPWSPSAAATAGAAPSKNIVLQLSTSATVPWWYGFKLYADDIELYYTIDSDADRSLLQSSLNRILEW